MTARILYHDCGQGVEEFVSKSGKYNEHPVTNYYPLKQDGEPYKTAVPAITQCPNCHGGLYDHALHKTPPRDVDPMEPPEDEPPIDIPPPPGWEPPDFDSSFSTASGLDPKLRPDK